MSGYGLTLVTDVTVEPLTRAEVERHLMLDDPYFDQDVTRWITAARNRAEQYTGRALAPQTWDLILDRFPRGLAPLYIPKPPLTSITSITYTDTAGASQTWSSANYMVGSSFEPARILPAFDEVYPSTRVIEEAVTVRFVAGYTRATIPEAIKQALLLMIGSMMEHRETVITGTIAQEVPQSAQWLLDPYKAGDAYHNYALKSARSS